jgi:hypothetical protein
MKPYRGVALRLALAQGASGLIGDVGTPFFGAWLGWKGLLPTEIGTLISAGLVMGLTTFASGPLYAATCGHAYLLMTAMGCAAFIFALLLARSWSGARITQSVSEEALDTI